MDAPLNADDRLAIMGLLARYAHVMDGTDPQAFLACFIPDAEMDVGCRTAKGEAEMRDFADYFAAKRGRPSCHHITTIAIEGDAERARSRCYMLITDLDEQGRTRHAGCCTHLDELVKIDDRWLIARRRVVV
ncbi:MAG: nuclear transport factor 2 family protein [Alphaproteobacteria bacterium]|nr:nuclear transport factor 2 family protein [Alphaproteobacteria bacterium]